MFILHSEMTSRHLGHIKCINQKSLYKNKLLQKQTTRQAMP